MNGKQWILCLAAGSLAGAALAAPNVSVRVDRPSSARERLEEIARGLAEREKAVLLVDPEIQPTRVPTPPAGRTLSRGLDELCLRLPGTAWRRVYLERSVRAQVKVERLAGVVRRLEQVEPDRLELGKPGAPRRVSLQKGEPDAALPAALRQAALDPAPVYLLYSTTSTADGVAPVDRLKDLQSQQLSLARSEEQQGRAMVRIFQALQNTPKNTVETALAPLHAAGMKAWETTPPEERRRLMDDSMPVIQRLLDLVSGAKAPMPPAPPVDYSPELQRILRELSTRFGTQCLSEPDLLVPERPVLAAPEKPAAQALDELAASLPGCDWREVGLPEPNWKRLGRPGALGRLAEAVRFLDTLEWGTVLVEDPGARQLTTFRAKLLKKGDPEQRDAALQRFYLLYSLTPAASRGSLEERLADLQTRQFNLLGRMTAPELTQSMEGLVQQYGGADAASRQRMIGLPLTAMLLGTWFPRAAKEQRK